MRPVAQHALSRKALMRYNGWSCVGSYLDVADRASLTDAFGIGSTALNAADAEYPVMFAAIRRNTFEKIRALEYLDGLLIPRREHAHSLSLQQRSRLWLGKFALVFYSEQIGWGVESAGAIPSGTLLFPYYGEFISSMEAKLRYQDNKRIQKMNFILTIREHIPATRETSEGVLISNIDAARKGSIARFVNHSCEPNTSVVMIREQGEVLGIPVLRTLRAIGGGEQITFHYGGGDAVPLTPIRAEVTVVAGRKEQSGCDNSTLLGKRGLDSASSTAVEQGDSGAKEARMDPADNSGFQQEAGWRRASANRPKRKMEKDMTLEDLLVGWTQCCYLVPRKQKLCNVARTAGSMYCGNHQPQDSTVDSETVEQSKKERIPCPIDGSHTIFRYNLKAHLKVCTKQKQNNAMSSLPYFKQDCNSGLPLSTSSPTNSTDRVETPSAPVINAEQLAEKVHACYERILAHHNQISSTYSNSPFLESVLPPAVAVMHDALTATITNQLGQDLSAQSRLRHVDQDILIAEQMIAHDLLHFTAAASPVVSEQESPRVATGSGSDSKLPAAYLELGAGRGLLSHAVSCADPSATVVLVERSGSRRKVDKALKDTFAAMDSAVVNEGVGTTAVGAVHRARMDIRHCYIPNLPGVCAPEHVPAGASQPVVVIAKHLCGVATDLAIHSLRAFPHIPRAPATSTAAIGQPAATHRVGLSIATCCHHACHFPDYTGREWYLSQGFTEGEFEVLRKWSGWANSGTSHRGDEREEATSAAEATTNAPPAALEHPNTATSVIRPAGITPEEMQAIGWKVKRIIDQGRVEFLRGGYGMAARQLKYCAKELSPECVMIVATER